jgi:hypothetical protein
VWADPSISSFDVAGSYAGTLLADPAVFAGLDVINAGFGGFAAAVFTYSGAGVQTIAVDDCNFTGISLPNENQLSGLSFSQSPNWAGLSLPADLPLAPLSSLDGSQCPSLASVDVSGFLGTLLFFGDCPVLSSFTFDGSTFANVTVVDVSGAALDEATVDGILTAIDNTGNMNGTVSLMSGTNAPPSAAGMLVVSSLGEKGWTVNVN